MEDGSLVGGAAKKKSEVREELGISFVVRDWLFILCNSRAKIDKAIGRSYYTSRVER